MRVLAMALAGSAVVVAGCATADMQRRGGPAAVLTSFKSPEQLRDCLVGSAPHVLTATPYQGGWMIASSVNPNMAQWIEVQGDANGSRASVFGMRGLRKSLERCA